MYTKFDTQNKLNNFNDTAQKILCYSHLPTFFLDIREQVVDFSYPYYSEGYAVVSASPKEIGRSLAILRPFSGVTWAILALFILIIGPIGYCIDRISNKNVREMDETNERSNGIGEILHFHLRNKEATKSVGKQGGNKEIWNKEATKSVGKQGGNKEIWIKEGTKSVGSYIFDSFRTIVLQGNFILSSATSFRLLVIFWNIFGLLVTCKYERLSNNRDPSNGTIYK